MPPQSSVFPTGANPHNRVQYANRVGRRLPGWSWLAAAVLIAVLVSGARLLIRPELLRIQIPGSKVFADPTGSETELATLVADHIVIALGITTDGSRLRIAAPVSGWIDSTVVQR